MEKKVRRYYDMGLRSREIGKLLDLNPRTTRRYIKQVTSDDAKPTPKDRKQKAIEMHANGQSYAEIAKRMKVCKTTVYLWCKKARQQTTG